MPTETRTAQYVHDADLTAFQRRRIGLAREVANAMDIEQTPVVTNKGSFATDDQIGIPSEFIEQDTATAFLLDLVLLFQEHDGKADKVQLRELANELDDNGIDHFAESGLSPMERERVHDLKSRIKEASKGDKVVWNGRSTGVAVTRRQGNWMDLEGSRGGEYRISFAAEDKFPTLLNKRSDKEYRIEEFEIVETAEEE